MSARVLELPARRQGDVVRARSRERDGDGGGFDHRVAVPDALLAEEAHPDHEVLAHARADPPEDAEREAQPVRQAPAVRISPRVQAREERAQRVRVRHVKLHAVEARGARARRCVAVRVDDAFDLLQ